MIPTVFEYLILTNTWKGARGAAYNAAYEFCQDFGWLNRDGVLTVAGTEAIDRYENTA